MLSLKTDAQESDMRHLNLFEIVFFFFFLRRKKETESEVAEVTLPAIP